MWGSVYARRNVRQLNSIRQMREMPSFLCRSERSRLKENDQRRNEDPSKTTATTEKNHGISEPTRCRSGTGQKGAVGGRIQSL